MMRDSVKKYIGIRVECGKTKKDMVRDHGRRYGRTID